MTLLATAAARGEGADDRGSLIVDTVPAGASVYIDGRFAGASPVTLPSIAPGDHRVRVVLLGHLENSRVVTVKAGARATVSMRLTDPAPQNAQASALKIVVLEGEGAVNVIQQKTAVAPLVEVRDRNDQPVAGAVVRFAIRNGRATFNGARTISVTSDAAGRAAAAGFAPTGSGALQITATAAFQGQTAAVTIAQTTVATAAQAAAVSGTAAAGTSSGTASTGAGAGAGSGGGGLSGTTLAVVGAAAAGAVTIKKLVFGKVYSGQFSGLLVSVDNTSRPCGRNEQQTGTIEMRLDDNGGAITGTVQIDGSIKLSPGTCQPDRYNTATDTFGLDEGQVTGTAQNLTFTANASNNYRDPDNPTGGGVNSYDYSFVGTFDGTQIIGALTIVRIVTYSNNTNPGITTRGSVTHSVTLR